MFHRFKITLVALVVATAPLGAQQVPCTPVASFGLLAAATFGGTAIPNHAVAQSTCGGHTIGLTATGRYSSPQPTNDGVKNFYAALGYDSNPPGYYAEWNMDFYTDGAANSVFAIHLPTGSLVPVIPLIGDNQDSWNIAMFFMGLDPNVARAFDFEVDEYTDLSFQTKIQSVDITVNAGSQVVATPEPATFGLLGTGLLGIGFAARRRKQQII
ncbi:MAG: hypothetical protein JWL80_640 [Parcubacteria group bacterium]|nr:hypothetical protein [Parcubacteria group bacterium]